MKPERSKRALRRTIEIQVFERSQSGRVVERGTVEAAYDRERRGGSVVPVPPRSRLVATLGELREPRR